MALSRYRSRSLKKLKRSFPGFRNEIDSPIASGSPVTILEVGCGYGIALLDLSRIYGKSVLLHGVNRTPADGEAQSLKEIAVKLNRYSEDDLLNLVYPEIHYFDVCEPWPLGGIL